ncbi:LOW QUALITY PROTEIN: PDZ domain-containing protein 7-like [Syngnathus typhle]
MAQWSDPSCREKVPGTWGKSHSAARNMVRKKEQRRRRGIRSSSPMGRVIIINSPVDGGDDSEDLHTITVDKSVDGKLGFSVRGGCEHGLSIFVSKVEDASTAEEAGLLVGDKLVEVNGVSLESITMSSAVKVLTGNNRLRMVVRRVGKVPGIRYSKEKTTWVDLIHRRMVVEESGRTPSEASAGSALRRIVHLYTTSDDYCLGFNIRGGKEFGLGIYVSKLDPGGLAERNGIKMGDQILAANGVSFEDISHSNAVEVLKSHTHVMLTIKEAGRYPAYKEMVAEYRWLNKLANGGQKSSSLGSESNSSASSLSSETPVSSLSGLSQVMFPPSLPFASDMVDVCISTEDQRFESERSEAAIQTDTTRSRGATTLLRDTAIRQEDEDERGPKRESHKTAVLLALSRPSRPISRSQSQVTIAEISQKKAKKQKGSKSSGEKSALQRSKTLVNLLFGGVRKKDPSRSRSKSLSTDKGVSLGGGPSTEPFPEEMLRAVEELAQRLLTEDETEAVMKACRTYLDEKCVEMLIRHLLAVLDRPEKLLLLREVRLMLPAAHLHEFNSAVEAVEVEAYDILKYRSVRTPPLRSPASGRAPKRRLITPIPDLRGGFELHSAAIVEKQSHLADKLEKLSLSGPRASRERRRRPNAPFSPLLDIPVDGYWFTEEHKHSPEGHLSPNWLVSENPAVGSQDVSDSSRRSPQEYELQTVSISKTKQSLGISISGGIESKVQPVVKVEKIFPGGAASTCDVLKVDERFNCPTLKPISPLSSSFEVVSVDGASLQGVTHQHAVDLIRKAFSDKTKDPMVLVVRVPRPASLQKDIISIA